MSELVSISKAVISNSTGLDAITRAPIVDYETKYRCLRIQNVSHKESFSKWGYTEVSEENYKNFQLHKDDIIISRTGGSIGTLKYIDKDYPAVYNNGLIRLVINKELYNPKYIYYCLKRDSFKQHILKCSLGNSTQENIRMSDMLEYKIADLPLEMQNRIACVLSVLDDKIKNNYQINAQLESMAKTIYDYWFLQFEFPNEDGKPYKSSGGKMIWNEELKREIPEGWEIDYLGNLFTSNRGISYNSETIEGAGVPMINLASFNVDGSYKEEGIKIYSGGYSEEKVVKPFDLLMCNTQQTAIDYKKDIIGKALLIPDIFDGDIVTSHHVTTIQVKKDSMKYFLHKLFNTHYFHKYAAGFTNGTNILGLIFSGIEKYRLEIPDAAILDKFAELMLEIEMKKSKIIKENQELISLRDFLLPLLMNGQVGFKD